MTVDSSVCRRKPCLTSPSPTKAATTDSTLIEGTSRRGLWGSVDAYQTPLSAAAETPPMELSGNSSSPKNLIELMAMRLRAHRSFDSAAEMCTMQNIHESLYSPHSGRDVSGTGLRYRLNASLTKNPGSAKPVHSIHLGKRRPQLSDWSLTGASSELSWKKKLSETPLILVLRDNKTSNGLHFS